MRKEMLKLLSFACAICLMGCSTSYLGKDILGADEFVRDSYKIREGKFSILEMQGQAFEALSKDLLNEYKDTVNEDDILMVAVYHPKRTDIMEAVTKIGESVGYRVSSGKITLPDLADIEVAGLTLEEAKRAIKKRYLEQIDDIEVFVTYKDRIAKKVELAGLVAISDVPVDGKMRLFDVLSKAHVPTDANFFKSYVIRNNKMLPVDLFKLMKQGDMSQNIVMRGADKVYISDPGAATLMVMGEVGNERVISLTSGYMSLREALAECRGIMYTGDKSYIQVIRGSIVNPKIYILNWEHVIHMPNDSLLLMPGDIVYVASKPITEWNRFISQLLPSFSGYDIVGKGIRNMGVVVP